MNTTNLGATLKAHRNAAGVPMRELSRLANVSPSYICDLENGRRNPTVKILEDLFSALGYQLIVTLRPDSGVEAIPEAPPLNLASRMQAGFDCASPDLLAAMAEGIEAAAQAHPGEAGQYWLSIAAEMRSKSHERRTGA